MAQTFPEKPVGSVAPEVARVFQTLKRLPDDWHVWYHLAPWEPEGPDFLVVDGERRALLLKVGRATPQQAHQVPQLEMFDIELETVVPGQAEEHVLDAFLAQIWRADVPRDAVSSAVIFPNLTDKDIRIIQQVDPESNHRWLGKDWVNGKGRNAWSDLFRCESLGDDALRILRAQFTPEVIVPASFVARIHRRRNIGAELGQYLLDYSQEHVLKTDLDLDIEGERLSRDFRIQVVNGVAGSGKTLVLLYRLRLLHALFPQKHFLVLTHNRPLIRDMEARFRVLNPEESGRIGWYTFMGWCRANWPQHQLYNPLSMRKRDELVREIWEECLDDDGVTETMFRSELEWAKDNGIANKDEYLEVNRRGRGFRLTQQQREQVFVAIQAYQKRLISEGVMDWWDVPRRLWYWIEQGKIKTTQYDVVMVDEAQFFASISFNIMRRLVLPQVGYLFLAADSTQGFLRRGESWKTIASLDVRGRSHRLRRSYRTTQAILNCALTFYRQRLPEDDEDLLIPDWAGMQKGKPPWLLRLESPQDERARIVNEIARAVEQDVPLRHMLVLCGSWQSERALRELLNQRLGGGMAVDPKEVPPGDVIRVTTINAGTGLESPIVFVSGIHEMFEKEESLRLTEDEKAELVRDNTRKLYMAFTRAGQRLIMTYVGGLPAPLEELARRDLLLVA